MDHPRSPNAGTTLVVSFAVVVLSRLATRDEIKRQLRSYPPFFFFSPPLPSPLSRNSSVNFQPTTSFLSYPKCNSASICFDRLIRKQVHFVVALDWCKRMSCLAGLSKMTLRWELSRNMLWILWYVIERFLIDWRKPKPKQWQRPIRTHSKNK